MDRLRAAWIWISEPSHLYYRFVPLFLGILWALTTLTQKIPQTAIQSFLETTACIDYFLLDAFLDGVSQRGTTLTHDGFSVQVITECTGLFEAVILVSAVLAYKARWSERGSESSSASPSSISSTSFGSASCYWWVATCHGSSTSPTSISGRAS
jgi:hypothetical protein